jgi:large subunit ribosomal protein L24
MSIRRNDIVVAIRGRNAGRDRTGKVLRVFPKTGRAIVEGMNLVTKHLRKSQANPKGGITQKEAPMALPNLMLYCPHCKRGVRAARVLEGERRVRKCRRCGHAFDT